MIPGLKRRVAYAVRLFQNHHWFFAFALWAVIVSLLMSRYVEEQKAFDASLETCNLFDLDTVGHGRDYAVCITTEGFEAVIPHNNTRAIP